MDIPSDPPPSLSPIPDPAFSLDSSSTSTFPPVTLPPPLPNPPPVDPTPPAPPTKVKTSKNPPPVDPTPPAPPTKVKKSNKPVLPDLVQEPLNYETYERWHARHEAFPIAFGAVDLPAYDARVPPAQLARWQRTFNYRHPVLMRVSALRPFFHYYDRMIYPIADLEDLSASPLLRAVLPHDRVEDSDLPYMVFEKYMVRSIVQRRYPKKLPPEPTWTQEVSRLIDKMDDELHINYIAHFVWHHPGHLDFLAEPELQANIRKAIWQNIDLYT